MVKADFAGLELEHKSRFKLMLIFLAIHRLQANQTIKTESGNGSNQICSSTANGKAEVAGVGEP